LRILVQDAGGRRNRRGNSESFGLAAIRAGRRQVHDANVVATMQAFGIARLLTDNIVDFNRFGSLIVVLPLVP
jgi:predicted nucleic acid-binding protein